MKFWQWSFAVAALAVAAVIGAGCDNGSQNNKTPSAPPVNVSGTWRLAFDAGAIITMTFAQDTNSVVQGVGQDATGGAWSFSGTISGDLMTGKMLPEATIKALVESNSMAGTYSTAARSGSFLGALQ